MAVKTELLSPSSPRDMARAVELLQQGECVAFPTETVYGLGANAFNDQAVHKIFVAKGRPADNPLIVHIHQLKQLVDIVTNYPEQARLLMDNFWPGPLTLVLPKTDRIPLVVSGGLDTVAVRMPNHPVALNLLAQAGVCLAAPSANLSGRPSPTRAEHVFEDLKGSIPAIVDGGETGWGVESTVVDCTVTPFRLLRPGGVTYEQLNQFVQVEVDSGVYGEIEGQPRSPGMKYKHYSPNAEVIVVVGDNIPAKISELIAKNQGKNIGVMAFSEHQELYFGVRLFDMGPLANRQIVASRIYHLLRLADHEHVELLLVEGLGEDELGMAIMNRLRKAAGHHLVYS